MSRSILAYASLIAVVGALLGCASAPEAKRTGLSPTPSWNKYYVAGSRIARKLDPQGQPLTGAHIITITDEELQNSAGVLLGEKLSGGYPR